MLSSFPTSGSATGIQIQRASNFAFLDADSGLLYPGFPIFCAHQGGSLNARTGQHKYDVIALVRFHEASRVTSGLRHLLASHIIGCQQERFPDFSGPQPSPNHDIIFWRLVQ